MNKFLIRSICQFLIGIGLFVALYFNMPGKLFITITIADSNLYNLIYIFDYSIAYIICFIFGILFYKDKFRLKGFVENLVIMAIIYFISLLLFFIQDFYNLGHPLSFLGIMFDGIIIPLYKGIGVLFIISVFFILPLYELIKIEKYKPLIMMLITSIIFIVVNIFLGYNKHILYYISQALCFSVLTIYLFEKEGTILPPILYYGICMTSILPNTFSGYPTDTMLNVVSIGTSILYFLVFGIVLTLMILKLRSNYSKE